MKKYRNKYRIPSTRWQKWDYGSNAAYYITICTNNRDCYFGDIVCTTSTHKIMRLSDSGKIVHQYWFEIPNHFPFIELDAFVVMPNHVHGIIIIDKPNGDDVETRLIASLQSTPHGGITGNKNLMIHKNLSRVVRWYKGRCSFEIGKLCLNFAWQSRFYDHVIRNHNEYTFIKDYIDQNIDKWESDSFHKS